MANKYSSLYTTPADQPGGPHTYFGPVAERDQGRVTAVAVVSGAVGNGDVIYLRGGLQPGEIITGLELTHTVDSNITAADLVLIPSDGSSNITLASASAALDGTANTAIAFTALASNRVPDNGKSYSLAFIAGAAGVASVHTIVINSVAATL